MNGRLRVWKGRKMGFWHWECSHGDGAGTVLQWASAITQADEHAHTHSTGV